MSDDDREEGRDNDNKAIHTNPYGVSALQRARAQARLLGRSATLESVKFLVWVRDNPSAPFTERVKSALAILDRFGFPTTQVTAFEAADEIPRKLFVTARFKDPQQEQPSDQTNGEEVH